MSDDVPKRQKKEESSDSVLDGGDLPEPFRLRRLIQNGVGLDRFLLAYNWVFLPWLSFILWIIFLVVG